MHAWPSVLHTGGPQVPVLLQGPEQHLIVGLHMAPSWRHIGAPQTLLLHWPVQHWVGEVHIAPSGEHIEHVWPQRVPTSFTQSWSQLLLQQNESDMQTVAAQGSQFGESAGPVTQTGCEHGLVTPQTPLLHAPEQHLVVASHIWPSGVHTPPPQKPTLLQGPVQHFTPG
jgi:hypothetical protein